MQFPRVQRVSKRVSVPLSSANFRERLEKKRRMFAIVLAKRYVIKNRRVLFGPISREGFTGYIET